MMKKIIISIICVGLIIGLGYILLPKPVYKPAVWGNPVDGGLKKYQFAHYNIPSDYEMMAYRESLYDNKKFVLFKNKKTTQLFAIFILREIPKIEFNNVEFEDKKIIRTVSRYYMMDIKREENFKLKYLVPFLINEDISDDVKGLAIRDINVTMKKPYETDDTRILTAEGNFKNLGFYRKSNSAFVKYTVPVFSFENPMNGSVAIINDKATGDTIFAFGCSESYRDYDKEEFNNIVKSITFQARPKRIFGF
jgi:hypothetical protein